ncbi:hypothetical protein GCM10011534_44840 [Pseudooceanicola nanhaiensis]|uniref:Uncharacterized protein n=1 Tax=Pseudooceanicola nanhaiensis TaxID=375761 RepID=A0A917TBY1_9RHOB|nr:hypothetical protein GCM10011534_44840 [Pseudooceanicola nanhaiensis]
MSSKSSSASFENVNSDFGNRKHGRLTHSGIAGPSSRPALRESPEVRASFEEDWL